jgi:DNA-binding transcriptional ArsR family regulator
MKHDMDLARQILLALEADPEADGHGWVEIEIDGRSAREISYHVRLLDEAGLIEARDCFNLDGQDWRPTRLTWEGHQFLEASRQETRWQKAKRVVLEKAGGLPFEALKQVLFQLLREAL